MKYCRFQWNGEAHYGLVESVAGRDAILRVLLTAPEEADGDLESVRTRRIEQIALEEAVLLPAVRPSKIVCVGRNYREHAAELGHDVPTEPLLFLKATSALLAPGGTVRRPKISERVDFEGELGVVIGRTCHQPAADEDVRKYILGYTCVNDVTARDLQKKESQFTRCKGFDSFAPIGPCIALTSPGPNLAPRGVEGWVNAERRQASSTGHLIFPIDHLVEYITFVMTLEPGDIISTGTPAGIGPITAGDTVRVKVDGVGELANPVEDER
jgi:2-keto-4-pentenoate hydratase/2-oxohepta-3-ene-1,7-dioic acid hydratase in catechol pathway